MKQAYFSLPCPNKIDNDSPIFRGYYDVKQNWNGWKCPKFKEKEFDKIVKYYLDKETNTEDMIEELKEFSDKKKNKVIINNEEYYDFGSFCLCWSAIESSDIINKLCDYVLKDEEYLYGILYEYLDILEEKEEIGLCGIVETLEDRGVNI